MISPGELIDNRYRVDRLIGEGGMGAVYAVTDTDGASYAVKVLLDLSDETMTKRFVREAQATARLAGENVARIYGSGTLADGTPYLLMELLRGEDLADLVHRRGALSVQEAVSYVLEVSGVLGEAHALGMVHRDIKPANLFVATRPDGTRCAKLLDFGISKPALNTVAPVTQLTQNGTILGTPQYMAPEQLLSSTDVDARADIWAIGVTLQELLTGCSAFRGDTLAEVVTAIMRDPPRSLREARPDVPAAIEAVILRCLQKDAELRYASTAELAQALRHALRQPQQAPPVMLTPSRAGLAPARTVDNPAAHAATMAHAATAQQGSDPVAAAWAKLPQGPGPRAATLMHHPSLTVSQAPVATSSANARRRRLWPVAAVATIGVLLVAAGAVIALTSNSEDGKRRAGRGDRAPNDTLLTGDARIPKRTRKALLKQLGTGDTRFKRRDWKGAEDRATGVLDEIDEQGLQMATDKSDIASRAEDLLSRIKAQESLDLARATRCAANIMPDFGELSRRLSETHQRAVTAWTWHPRSLRCSVSAVLDIHITVGKECQELAMAATGPKRYQHLHLARSVVLSGLVLERSYALLSPNPERCRNTLARGRAALAALRTSITSDIDTNVPGSRAQAKPSPPGRVEPTPAPPSPRSPKKKKRKKGRRIRLPRLK